MRPEPLSFLLPFLAGFLGAFVSTEAVRHVALRIGAVDHPGGRRVHRSPTARLGGLAIACGLGVALTVSAHGGLVRGDREFMGLMAAMAVVLYVGTLDDLRGMRAGTKLLGQTVAAVALWSCGWRVEQLGIPAWGVIGIGDASLPLTVLWVVAVVNALNLIDGLDGLASGMAFFSALGFAWLLGVSGDPGWVLAAGLAGAVAGFLWFNLSPALIFMGDAGSHLLGIVLAALSLRLAGSESMGTGPFPIVPALLLAVPMIDLTWAVVRRTFAGRHDTVTRSPMDVLRRLGRADGAHVHHRLLAAGWSPRAAVGLLWNVAAACAGVAVMLALWTPVAAIVAMLAAGGWALRSHIVRRSRVRSAPSTLVRSPVASTPHEGHDPLIEGEEIAA